MPKHIQIFITPNQIEQRLLSFLYSWNVCLLVAHILLNCVKHLWFFILSCDWGHCVLCILVNVFCILIVSWRLGVKVIAYHLRWRNVKGLVVLRNYGSLNLALPVSNLFSRTHNDDVGFLALKLSVVWKLDALVLVNSALFVSNLFVSERRACVYRLQRGILRPDIDWSIDWNPWFYLSFCVSYFVLINFNYFWWVLVKLV